MAQNFGSMSAADSTKEAREALRVALGLGVDVPFADYINHLPANVWTPAELFRANQKGFWYEPNDITTLFKDAAGTSAVTMNNDPIGLMKDKSPNGCHAMQSVSAKRPSYKVSPPRIVMDKVDDEFIVVIPAGGWVGEMVIATDIGTACYGVSLPAGNYLLGGRYFPSSAFMGIVFRQGVFSAAEKSALESYFVSKHAVDSYINSISLDSVWRDFKILTSFPLINTASATSLYLAWYGCSSLTSFPLINTASATSLYLAWYGCSSLTSFPLINTANVTNLSDTWSSCTSLTSFPLINTANVTNLSYAWYRCASLTSFPLINMASVTNFSGTWSGCTSLTNFPLNAFDCIKGGNMINAFSNTNLNQESIDGILVSLVVSGITTGTRTFNQSGGSAPSEIGKAAIDTLRMRGWTVTTTGGY